MYATAAWLAWVLAQQRGADAVGLWMGAAILLALAAWAWTHAPVSYTHLDVYKRQLRQTWVDVPAAQQANLAQGHNKSGEVPHQHYPACAGSWGALKTSSTGLMDFLEAHLNPGKLTPDWQRAIGITQTGWYRTPLTVSYTHLDVYKRQLLATIRAQYCVP